MIDIPNIKEYLSYTPMTGEFRWLVSRNSFAGKTMPGDIAGAFQKTTGYWRIGLLGHRVYAHRLAWFFVHGVWPSAQIDHINGDRLDNRIANLREATNAQNQCNRKPTAKSGIKGVHKHPSGGWTAEIKVSGKKRHIGYYGDIRLAEIAHAQVAVLLHGTFARF